MTLTLNFKRKDVQTTLLSVTTMVTKTMERRFGRETMTTMKMEVLSVKQINLSPLSSLDLVKIPSQRKRLQIPPSVIISQQFLMNKVTQSWKTCSRGTTTMRMLMRLAVNTNQEKTTMSGLTFMIN